MNIGIIGSGVTCVTTADALLCRGHNVTIIERQPYAAMETSFANGGQLSASNAEVWNSWGTIAKGLKWMFKQDAPLLMNLRPSWHKYSWLAEFMAAIPQYRSNTAHTVKLALEARKHLFAIEVIKQIEPSLQGKFFGGFYTPSDATGDIHKFTFGLAQTCHRRGALFVNQASVSSINASKGSVQ